MHERIRFARGSESARKNNSTVLPIGMPAFSVDANLLYIGDETKPLSELVPIGSSKLVSSTNNGYAPISTTDKKLIYFDNGIPVESAETVGSNTKLMYLNNGQFVESNASVANDGKTLMYLNSGILTASTQSLGSTHPLKLVNGQLQENTGTLDNDITGNAATADEATNSIYINNQKIELKGSNYSSYYHSIIPNSNAFDSNIVTCELIWTNLDDSNFNFETEYQIKSGSLNAGDIIYIDFDNHYIGSRFTRLLKDGSNNVYVVLHNTYGVKFEGTSVNYATYNFGVKLDVIKPSTSSAMFDSIKFTLTGCFVHSSVEGYKDWGINREDFKVRAIYRIRGLSGINLSLVN